MEEYKQIFTANGYMHDEENKRFVKSHRVKRNEIIINGQRSEMFENITMTFDYSDELTCSFQDDESFRGFKLFVSNGQQTFEHETIYTPVNELYRTIVEYEKMIFGT